MRICIRLSQANLLAQAEEMVFAFLKNLEKQCDSISTCEILVEGACLDPVNAGGCIVRLELHVFGERVNVIGTNSTASAVPLRSALQSTYRKAVRALHLVARKHHACSCHSAAAA